MPKLAEAAVHGDITSLDSLLLDATLDGKWLNMLWRAVVVCLENVLCE